MMSAMMNQGIGAGLGMLSGLTSPNMPLWDYKKAGVGYLTGYGADRQKAFAPYMANMGKIATTGGQMSAMDRLKFAGGELAQLGSSLTAAHQGINERSIQRGAGAGDGMAEAAHLSADMGGLNAKRGLLGTIAANESGNRIQNQMGAFSQLANLYAGENQQENDQVYKQYESKVARTMQGSKLHRGLNGAAQGWSSSGGGGMGMG